MNFKEKALQEYQNKKIEEDLKNEKLADAFCEKALNVLKEQFDLEDGFDKHIKIIDKDISSVKVILDEMVLLIRFSRGYYEFEMIKKCPRCGEEYTNNVKSLENIGKFLVEEHNKFDCDKIIERSRRTETTQERFINALRDLIFDIENDNI